MHVFCWNSLIYQIVKLYELPKISLRTLKSVYNVSLSEKDLGFNETFSRNEQILLRWSEYNLDLFSKE